VTVSARGRPIRVTVTPAAYAVIVATLPNYFRFEPNNASNGDFHVCLEPRYVERLRVLRRPGESDSCVILRPTDASGAGE